MGLLDSTTQQQYYSNDDFGNYQFVSLDDIINQFIIVYTGEDKLISKTSRVDVAFHAQRGLAEMSFDTFKSCKAQEITLQPNLQMILPQDYVNYVKISWIGADGLKRRINPTTRTSNPKPIYINKDGGHEILAKGTVTFNSDTIVLDGYYAEIIPGMAIRNSGSTLDGSLVLETQTTADITSLKMSNTATNAGGKLINMEFVNPSGELHTAGSVIQVTNFFTTTGDKHAQPFISASVIPDGAKDVKVGMYVDSPHFPVGTRVTSVPTFEDTAFGASNEFFFDQASLSSPNGYTATFIFSDKNPDSTTWGNYKSANTNQIDHQAHHDHDYDHDYVLNNRYGLDPQYANVNGSFYIDCNSGKIHFSSDLAGRTIVLDYISDSLGTALEMQVHKFAEEAMYKFIAHGILSGKSNIPEYQVNRLKKERFAAVRTAKLRLSNIKLEELTQILRGKSKQIKH
tara:strand:+ start:751 stop:2118 length:1368 start_codon:yes stop_codon:yes gene_type:complete